jgi:hypothetical protein
MIKKIVGYSVDYTIKELSWWYKFTKKIPSISYKYSPTTNSYFMDGPFNYPEFDNSLYEKLGKPKINKWYKVRELVDQYKRERAYLRDLWIPLFEKPLTEKPILQKPEFPKTTPLPTQPPKVAPPKSVDWWVRLHRATLWDSNQLKTATPRAMSVQTDMVAVWSVTTQAP